MAWSESVWSEEKRRDYKVDGKSKRVPPVLCVHCLTGLFLSWPHNLVAVALCSI